MTITTPHHHRADRIAHHHVNELHVHEHEHDDRGDVPGWVMITVMSAGIVAVLTAVAGPQLRQMLSQALQSVGG